MLTLATLATVWDSVSAHPWWIVWSIVALFFILLLWWLLPELIRYIKIERM